MDGLDLIPMRSSCFEEIKDPVFKWGPVFTFANVPSCQGRGQDVSQGVQLPCGFEIGASMSDCFS